MILSAIISSLIKHILAHVVKFNTSRDVWQASERMFNSLSRARTMQIHYQLATLKKGNSSIANYFHQFTSLVDTIAAIAHALNDFEIISFLLVGLGFEYDSFVKFVTTRVDPLSIDELYGHLLAHELRLKHQQPTVHLSLAGANFAGRGPSRGGHGGGSSPSAGCDSSSRNQQNFRGRGHGHSSPSSQNHPIYQVCHKTGHTTLKCYHRFDNPFSTDTTSNMHALLAAPQALPDLNWYPDSGATHHLTSDLENLNVKAEEYHGLDQIRIGNGIDSNWRAAMNLEFDALLKNYTWVLVPPHTTRNVIGCKWVFRVKHNADGFVERYKARLVAKGFH
ncbi:uncharacterized protein LOC142605988 [Castanea sativa]|uniref:uncharacterized protein LOC142605988 n=1 Tax=Castanea sativa TaxID=21020 RepID=UPI003F64B666